MFVRVVTVAASVLVAGSASAESLDVATAHRFVVGKTFAYNCFDGTRGAGRIQNDLSVAGTIQVRGSGPVRFVHLPPGTLKVKGSAVCASVRGVPFEPCFDVNRTAPQSFRGSISGLSFAYCDFTRRQQRTPVRSVHRSASASQPMAIHAAAVATTAGD